MTLGSTNKPPPIWQRLTGTYIELPSMSLIDWPGDETPQATKAKLSLPDWHPHAGQAALLGAWRRFNVMAMGRRFGKTYLLQRLALEPAVERGQPVAWFAPHYKLLDEAWREMLHTATPYLTRSNATARRMEFASGGVIEFWSLEDANAGRSRKYARAIVDEAGMVKHLLDIWHTAIRPTLADLGGDAYFAGTPKGRNGFWELWQKGQDPDATEWASWQAPTWANPFIASSEIDAMRESMPALAFAQEVEAAFVEDALTLFRLDDIARAERHATGEAPRTLYGRYVTTVDVGRRRDATIINTFDVNSMPYQRVAFERLERVPYPVIQHAIERRYADYGGDLWIESNGVGDPVIENLNAPARPFLTTARSKVQALEALIVLFEQGHIAARWDSRERAALQAASWDDAHTADEVMSLAIFAAMGATSQEFQLPPSFSVRRYR